jgi:ribosomal protein S18 acetylase RimI-like enzyme
MALWSIRNAVSSDADNIASFAIRTFRENFTHYDPAGLDAFFREHYDPKKFRAELNNPANRFWLAESQGQIIGYANIGDYKLPLEPAASRIAELWRLYVLKEWHGKRIGAALMDLALEEAKARKAEVLYLGVWEHNTNAQGFYNRYGFSKVGEYDYPPVGDVVDREWIMMKDVII